MKVLAIDPGHTTGICVANDDSGKLAINYQGEIKDWHGLDHIFRGYSPEVLVFEIFKLYAHKANYKAWDEFLEIQVIGVAKYLAEVVWYIPIIGQTPSEGKHYFSEARLKKMGLFPTSSVHAMDATSHALYFLEFNKKKVV